MSPQVLIEKFGGFVTATMNGWLKSPAELTVRDVPFVPVNLSVRITVCKPKILNYPRNGIQPRTEILHQRMLPPVKMIKFGGVAKKAMNGRPMLEAEIREPDALFALDDMLRKKITFR